jgi:hypothetical protein
LRGENLDENVRQADYREIFSYPLHVEPRYPLRSGVRDWFAR